MKAIYDPETDTLTLILRDEPISESDELRDGIILDFGKDGRIVSLEVLDAFQHVAEPRSFAYEIKAAKTLS